MAIYSRMTNTSVEILASYGLHKPDYLRSPSWLVLARFKFDDGDPPEDRYVFAHTLVADNGAAEIEAEIMNARQLEFSSDDEMADAYQQAA